MKWAAFLVSLVTMSRWALALPMPGRCLVLHEISVPYCSRKLDTDVSPSLVRPLNLDSAYPEDIDALR